MDHAELAALIEAAWERRAELSPTSSSSAEQSAVEQALDLLDSGQARVASRGQNGDWTTHQWLKKAVLLSFRLSSNVIMSGSGLGAAAASADVGPWWDKVPLKTHNWRQPDFEQGGFRAVPGAIVRRGAYVAKNVVLM